MIFFDGTEEFNQQHIIHSPVFKQVKGATLRTNAVHRAAYCAGDIYPELITHNSKPKFALFKDNFTPRTRRWAPLTYNKSF